jgi:hypothetical protein
MITIALIKGILFSIAYETTEMLLSSFFMDRFIVRVSALELTDSDKCFGTGAEPRSSTAHGIQHSVRTPLLLITQRTEKFGYLGNRPGRPMAS